MTGLRERVAEELWQAEWARVHGGRRRVPWAEIAPSDQEKWCHFADAAIAVCMEEAAKVVEATPKYVAPDRIAAALRALRGEGGVDG